MSDFKVPLGSGVYLRLTLPMREGDGLGGYATPKELRKIAAVLRHIANSVDRGRVILADDAKPIKLQESQEAK